MATVLVVDDEPSILELLKEIVDEVGHKAIAAANGRDALALAHEYQPELIISDVRMPIMDGYALLEALRVNPAFRNTMVILFSANFLPSQLQIGTPTSYIPKPLDISFIEGFLQGLQ